MIAFLLQREVEALHIQSTARGVCNMQVQLSNELVGRIIYHLPLFQELQNSTKCHMHISESHTTIYLSGNCQDTLCRLKEMIENIAMQMESIIISELLPIHSMYFPMIGNPVVAEAVRAVEKEHLVAVSILQMSGNPMRISKLATALNSSSRLVQICDLVNYIIPCTPTPNRMVWVAQQEAQGGTMSIRPDLNRYLNDCYYNQQSDRTEFTLNGVQYVVDFQTDTIKEVSSSTVLQLSKRPQPISWSYFLGPDVGYVAHEPHDSEAIEQMYQYGGDHVMLAGIKHTFNFDPTSMCQIDLTTGNKVPLRREPIYA